jgi:hypothetical protein
MDRNEPIATITSHTSTQYICPNKSDLKLCQARIQKGPLLSFIIWVSEQIEPQYMHICIDIHGEYERKNSERREENIKKHNTTINPVYHSQSTILFHNSFFFAHSFHYILYLFCVQLYHIATIPWFEHTQS